MGPGSGGSPCLRRPSPVPASLLPPARARADCPSAGGAAIDAAAARSVGGAITGALAGAAGDVRPARSAVEAATGAGLGDSSGGGGGAAATDFDCALSGSVAADGAGGGGAATAA